MTVFDDFDKLKKNGLPQMLVLVGEEEDLLQELKEQLFSTLHFSATDLSQAYFDLTASNADLALEELDSLPFFSENKVVILENLVNLTTVKKTIFDEKQSQRFESFLQNPLPSTQLILILHGKLDSRLKVVKKLKTRATILEAAPLRTAELVQYFTHLTGLSKPILTRISEKSADRFSVIKQNIDLVKMYAAGREPTVDDVEKVIPKSLEDNVFQLSDWVFKGKIGQARELVHDLTLQGEDLIKILAILTNAFRLDLQVKIMQEKGWSEAQQIQFLNIHPYPVKLANQLVRKINLTELSKGLLMLIELDFQLKNNTADKDYLFDVTLIKLTLKKG